MHKNQKITKIAQFIVMSFILFFNTYNSYYDDKSEMK